MDLLEKLLLLQQRGQFYLFAYRHGEDHFIENVNQDGTLDLMNEGNEKSYSIPLSEVTDLTFSYRFILGKRASATDFDPDNLAWRWGTYCQFMDLTDESASTVLGRQVVLSQLKNSKDWQRIMVATIGL